MKIEVEQEVRRQDILNMGPFCGHQNSEWDTETFVSCIIYCAPACFQKCDVSEDDVSNNILPGVIQPDVDGLSAVNSAETTTPGS